MSKNYSLDTNLIVPLIIESHRLNPVVKKIIKDEDNSLFLCKVVINELKTILRDKIAIVIKNSLKNLSKLNEFDSKIDRTEYLIKSLNELKREDSYHQDFYNILFERILDFLNENEVNKLGNFLTEFNIHATRSIYPTIEKYVDFEIKDVDYSVQSEIERYVKIKGIISKIRFKDKNDEEIFCHLATLAKIEFNILFYTNDEECFNKSEKSLKKLNQELNYAPSILEYSYAD